MNNSEKIIEQKIINWRRVFHKFPEPGWCEYKTSVNIIKELRKLNFELTIGTDLLQDSEKMGRESKEIDDFFFNKAISDSSIDQTTLDLIKDGNTSILATLDCGKGPNTLLRFDMDALHISESKLESHIPHDKKFSSEYDGFMHACGHDAHSAIGLGVATILSERKKELKGTITLLFQAAEEGVRGAAALTDHPFLNNIDSAIGFHLWSTMPTGRLICGTDEQMASTKFDLEIIGKEAHAGLNPEQGINALIPASEVVCSLYKLVSKFNDKIIFNIGKLEAGTARNIICASAILQIETRAKNSKTNTEFYNKCIAEIKKVLAQYKTTYKISKKGYALAENSNLSLAQEIRTRAEKIEFFSTIILKEKAGGNSEDFTNIMAKLHKRNKRATYIGIGASNTKGAHHTPVFDINEETLLPTAKLLVDYCINMATV